MNLVEIIQRRHIAVHNDGQVSRAYQGKMKDLADAESIPDLGTHLPITKEYLDGALDELEAVGNLLAAAVWTKSLSDAEEVVLFELYVRSYDLLVAGRWAPTACISTMAIKRLKPDEDLYLVHKVNAWLSRKRMGEDVSSEVQNWSTQVLGTRYQVAQAALLDDFEGVDRLLRRALPAEDLDIEDAWEWPLFAEFRESDLWLKIVKDFSKDAVNGSSDRVV